jgi:hypothetical protein
MNWQLVLAEKIKTAFDKLNKQLSQAKVHIASTKTTIKNVLP